MGREEVATKATTTTGSAPPTRVERRKRLGAWKYGRHGCLTAIAVVVKMPDWLACRSSSIVQKREIKMGCGFQLVAIASIPIGP